MVASFRPLARLGEFPTGEPKSDYVNNNHVSVPSRGLGSFLRKRCPQIVWFVCCCFRPLSRLGWFPTWKPSSYANVLKFPSPREAWVVSYLRRIFREIGFRCLSFPAPLEVWVGSYQKLRNKTSLSCMFPAPREDWVGSYRGRSATSIAPVTCFRPLSRYGGGPTIEKAVKTGFANKFPAPCEASVVSNNHKSLRKCCHKQFPAPREAWVGSYQSCWILKKK